MANSSTTGPQYSVLFFDAYPHGMYGAQQTLFELATQGAGRPIGAVVADGPLSARLEAKGIDVVVLPYPGPLNSYRKTLITRPLWAKAVASLYLLWFNIRAISKIRAQQIDIIYCGNTRSMLSIGLAAKLLRLPIVWYVQQLEESFGVADQIASLLATRIVTISSHIDRVFGDKPGSRIAAKHTVVPLGTNGGSLHMTHRDRDPLVLTIVGTITPDKGHHLLADALARRPSAAEPRIHVRVVGTPTPDDTDYARAVAESFRQLEPRVTCEMLGWREDVEDLLADSDLFVLPSLKEGLPRSIMEAMAAHVPVIATNVGAVVDLVVDGTTGALVDRGDATALSNAIDSLASSSELRRDMGAAAAALVASRFRQRDFVVAFDKIFGELAQVD